MIEKKHVLLGGDARHVGHDPGLHGRVAAEPAHQGRGQHRPSLTHRWK